MKSTLNFLSSFLMATIVATVLSWLTPVQMHVALGFTMGASALLGFLPLPSGAKVVVLKEMYLTELVKAFRGFGNWMSRIPRKDEFVGNNVINLAELGADPTLLINNTTYPITTAARTDDNIALVLNKYDTTNTKVTRDELYALPYDKPGSIIEQHKLVIDEGTRQHGLWNLTIAGNTGTTPLVETTGAERFSSSRRSCTTNDIIALKNRLDALKAPQQGRCLVMCSQHINELLVEDQSFQLRYQNHTEGKLVTRYHGFDIYEDSYNPVFTAANAKKAYGAASAGTDRNASVCFIAERTFQATGTTEMFYRDATMDPENRETVVGFQLYHIVAPKKTTAFGVIVSDDLL